MACLQIRRRRSSGSWPLREHSSSRRVPQLLALTAIVCAMPPSPLLAQMVISLSVYNQTWSDGSTVYGTTTTADNSTLGQCGHSGYETQTTLITLDGTPYQSTSGGFTASVTAPYDGPGQYTELGTFEFHCSCAGPIEVVQETNSCVARSSGARRCTGAAAAPSKDAHTAHNGRPTTYRVASVLRVSLPATDRSRSLQQSH